MTTQSGFEERVVRAVAEEYAVPVADLRALLERHQSAVRENPGADSLVYEWRKYHPGDPLVTRTESWYVCAVRASVWTEFAAALDTDLGAVRAVHDRQARAVVPDADHDAFEDGEAMLFARG